MSTWPGLYDAKVCHGKLFTGSFGSCEKAFLLTIFVLFITTAIRAYGYYQAIHLARGYARGQESKEALWESILYSATLAAGRYQSALHFATFLTLFILPFFISRRFMARHWWLTFLGLMIWIEYAPTVKPGLPVNPGFVH